MQKVKTTLATPEPKMQRAFFLTFALMLTSVSAVAQSDQPVSPGAASHAASQGRLSGTVIGIHDETIYLQGQQGLVIPLQVSHETRLDGETVGRLSGLGKQIEKHYPIGSNIEIVFEVRHGGNGEIENVATSIRRR